jgi:hypothetical protein
VALSVQVRALKASGSALQKSRDALLAGVPLAQGLRGSGARKARRQNAGSSVGQGLSSCSSGHGLRSCVPWFISGCVWRLLPNEYGRQRHGVRIKQCMRAMAQGLEQGEGHGTKDL